MDVPFPVPRPLTLDDIASVETTPNVPMPVPRPPVQGPVITAADIASVEPAITPDDIASVDPAPAAPSLGEVMTGLRDRNEIGVLEELYNAGGRGVNSLQNAVEIGKFYTGLSSATDVAKAIVQNQQDAQAYPMSVQAEQGLREVQASDGIGSALVTALTNPRALATVAAESLPASLPSVVGTVGGAFTAGPAGAAVGAGVGSGLTEFASSIVDGLTQAGYEPTWENIAFVMENPEMMGEIQRKAAQRGLMVGALDAVGGGLAGRVAGPAGQIAGKLGVKSPVAKTLTGVAAEGAVQASTGAAGEAGAQMVVSPDWAITDPGSVALEAAAELPGAALEIPGAMAAIRARTPGVEGGAPPVEPPAGMASPPSPPVAPPAPTPGTPPNATNPPTGPAVPVPPEATTAPNPPPAAQVPAPPPASVGPSPVPPSPAPTAPPVAPPPAVQPPGVPPAPAPPAGAQPLPPAAPPAGPAPANPPVAATPPVPPAVPPVPASPPPAPKAKGPSPLTQPTPFPEPPVSPPVQTIPPDPGAAPVTEFPLPPPIAPPATLKSPRAQQAFAKAMPMLEATRKKALSIKTPDQGYTLWQTIQKKVWAPQLEYAAGRVRDAKANLESAQKGFGSYGTLDEVADDYEAAQAVYSQTIREMAKDSLRTRERFALKQNLPPGADPVVYVKQPPGSTIKDLSPKIVDTFRGWVRGMGLGHLKIELSSARFQPGHQGSAGTASIPAGKYSGAPKGVDKVLVDRDIQIDPAQMKDDAHALEILAHELGHILDTEVFSNAPKATQDAIDAEYLDWIEKNVAIGINATKGSVARARSPIGAIEDRLTETGSPLATDQSQVWNSYAVAFDEWFAEQVAKWAMTTAKPQTIVEKFFSAVAQKYRRLVAAWKGVNPEVLPRGAVADFLDNMHKQKFRKNIPTVPGMATPAGKSTPDLMDGMDTPLPEPDRTSDAPPSIYEDQAPDSAQEIPLDTLDTAPVDYEDRLGDSLFESSMDAENLRYISEDAFRDAGVTPDAALTLAPAAQIKILSKLMGDFFGMKVDATKADGLEARDQLLDGYRNMKFMAAALGLPAKALGLGNSLTLNLIRKTKRTRYLGLYQPATQSIALPGRTNSFAHEWAHALDHWMMLKIGPQLSPLLSQWTRGAGLAPNTPVKQAFVDVMNALFFDDAKFAARVLQLQQDASGTGAKAKAAQVQLDKIKNGSSPLLKERSDFYKTSRFFGKGNPYWTDPAEMFARAFEAYVGHKTRDIPGLDRFVSKGDVAYMDKSDARLALTFPKDLDRIRVFNAIDQLLDVVRQDGLFGDKTPAAMPTPSAMVDMYEPLRRIASDVDETSAIRKMREDFGKALDAITRLVRGDVAVIAEGRDEMSLRTGGEGKPVTKSSRARRLMDGVFAVIATEAGNAYSHANRNVGRGAEYLRAIAGMFHRNPGSGNFQDQTFHKETTSRSHKDMALVAASFRLAGLPLDVPLRAISPKFKKMLAQRERLTILLTDGVAGLPDATADELKAAAEVRRMLDDKVREARSLDINVGYVTDEGYLPRALNREAVFADVDGFKAAAKDAYVVDGMSDAAAEKAASDWYLRLVAGNNALGEPLGPDTSVVASREFSAEAHEALKAFYEQDPGVLIRDYILKMNRLIAYRRRVGNPSSTKSDDLADLLAQDPDLNDRAKRAGLDMSKPADRAKFIVDVLDGTHDKVGLLAKEAAKAGADAVDIAVLRNTVEFMAGQMKDGSTSSFRSFANSMHLYGTFALMGRAGWASLTEPVAIALASKSLKGTLTALGQYAQQIPGVAYIAGGGQAGVDAQRHLKALAIAIGAVKDPYVDQALGAMMDLSAPDSPSSQRLGATFYALNWVAGLTNAQNRAAIPAWHVVLTERLGAALDTTDQIASEKALADLREFGVEGDMVQRLSDWIENLGGKLPPLDATLESPEGKVWQKYILEGVTATIQDPDKGTKPRFASHPFGRLVFGLLSFAYTFQRNMHRAIVNRTYRDAQIRQDAGETPVAAWTNSVAANGGHALLGFTALFAGSILTTALREAIFNAEEWRRREKEGTTAEWLMGLAFSRTGAYGAFDPLVQAATSLRYQRDLTAMTAGPYMGTFLQAVQSIVGLGINNSPNTNNAEYKAIKDSYRGFVAPLVALGVTATPWVPDVLKSAAIQYLTSNRAADNAAQLLVGEKDSTFDKRKKQERLAKMTPAERRKYEERQLRAKAARERRAQERAKQKELENADF